MKKHLNFSLIAFFFAGLFLLQHARKKGYRTTLKLQLMPAKMLL